MGSKCVFDYRLTTLKKCIKSTTTLIICLNMCLVQKLRGIAELNNTKISHKSQTIESLNFVKL